MPWFLCSMISFADLLYVFTRQESFRLIFFLEEKHANVKILFSQKAGSVVGSRLLPSCKNVIRNTFLSWSCRSWGLFLESPVNVLGSESCWFCIQFQSFNNFENDTMKLSVNEAKLISFVGYTYNHGQKSWDTFSSLGRFPMHTGPTPPLTPQTMLDEVRVMGSWRGVSKMFSEFQLCIG